MSPLRARWASVLCALAAACALVFSTQLAAWWAFSGARVYLIRAERCFGGECQGTNLAWLGASAWWYRLSAATFGVGLFTALLALFVAGARAAGRMPRSAASSLQVAAATALCCAVGTVLSFPRLDAGRTWSWGLGIYAAGLVLAVVAARMVRSAPRPQ